MRPTLVFVHGRAQQGRDPVELRGTWLDALYRGLGTSRAALLDDVEVAFPFYGDVLDGFARQMDDDVPPDVVVRGPPTSVEPGYVAFQSAYVEELRARLGLALDGGTTGPAGAVERGALNWGWVLSLLRAADALPGVSASAIERFTRDVYLYLSRRKVRDSINAIVADAIPDSPAIVVAHSLGSVVAYDVLRSVAPSRKVNLLATIGCPLGVGPICRTFSPLVYPGGVGHWFNALDMHDTVALNALDAEHFPIDPPVENYLGVTNCTENRHGITGYLNDPQVAGHIGDALENLKRGA